MTMTLKKTTLSAIQKRHKDNSIEGEVEFDASTDSLLNYLIKNCR